MPCENYMKFKFVHKVLLEQSHCLIYVLSMAVFYSTVTKLSSCDYKLYNLQSLKCKLSGPYRKMLQKDHKKR